MRIDALPPTRSSSQELQGGAATQLEIFRLVDHPHATAAQNLQHAVLADPRSGQVGERGRLWCRRNVGGRSVRVQPLDGGQKTVPPSRQRLDVTRAGCRVAQRPAQRSDRDIDDVVEVDDCVIGPEPLLDLAPRDDLPLLFDEHPQNLEGLLPEHDLVRRAVRRT